MANTSSALRDKQPMPRILLVAPVIYIAGLVATLIIFHSTSSVNVFGMRIPLTAAWFGALGGVVASLQGMFFHNKNWDSSYNIWHVFSGAVGIAYGFAAYLFLLVVVKSAAPTANSSAGPVFPLAAFAIGYGQSQFHAMMLQVYNIVFHQPKGAHGDAANHEQE